MLKSDNKFLHGAVLQKAVKGGGSQSVPSCVIWKDGTKRAVAVSCDLGVATPISGSFEPFVSFSSHHEHCIDV